MVGPKLVPEPGPPDGATPLEQSVAELTALLADPDTPAPT